MEGLSYKSNYLRLYELYRFYEHIDLKLYSRKFSSKDWRNTYDECVELDGKPFLLAAFLKSA